MPRGRTRFSSLPSSETTWRAPVAATVSWSSASEHTWIIGPTQPRFAEPGFEWQNSAPGSFPGELGEALEEAALGGLGRPGVEIILLDRGRQGRPGPEQAARLSDAEAGKKGRFQERGAV